MILKYIMKKFLIKTNGCKANQLESEIIKEKLLNSGYAEAKNINDAEIYILNSCSVTENADIDALRALRNIKSKNNAVYTVITGCSAQLNAENIKELDYIDLILGNDDKFGIVEAIKENTGKVSDIFKVKTFNNQPIHNYSKTRGYVKIQDGCNNYCSYCTIPLARGNSRSNNIENILEQIKIYSDANIKEIVLTGIHIGQWGEDFDTPADFLRLIEEIEKTDIKRYRLGSLNPLEISDNLLKVLSQSEKFCPHFHLSLQSLNDRVLYNMNRHYSAQECLELTDKIEQHFNIPFIGSDIIVGFPDESDEDFEITCNNAIKAKLSNIHVFPYSIRRNTKAAEMKNQIPEKVKHLRAEKLHKIANEKYKNFIEKNIGTTAEILVEKRPDKHTGFPKGITKNYLTIHLNDTNKDIYNTIQNVRIEAVDSIGHITGKII